MKRERFGRDLAEPFYVLPINTTMAVKGSGLIFTRSDFGVDPATGVLPADVESQTRFTLEALERVLIEAGSDITHVVKVTVYLSDIERDFAGMDGVYKQYLTERGISEPPARTTIGVTLPADWGRVEMDMIALAVEQPAARR
jgi:enamine deaminase RidA (YjgF/YER057c/UK114 family)